MPASAMNWRLRPVTPMDQALIFELYGSTRADELAMVPWSAEQKHAFLQHQVTAQERYYWERYPASEHLVVEAESGPVGRLWLDRQADRIHLLDLILQPEDAPLRTALLEHLQSEAAAGGQAVTIYLESFHPARPLFERLGFIQEGEQGAHLLLAWRCARGPSKQEGETDGPALRR